MRRFLIPIIILLLADLTALGIFVLHNSPFTDTGEVSFRVTGIASLLLLFGSWILAGIIIYALRTIFGKPDSPRLLFRGSLRQGLWIALFIVTLLIFQLIGIVHILNVALLICVLFSLELYFNSRSHQTENPVPSKDKLPGSPQ